MPQFFLNKRLIVLLICIIFLVALIGVTLRERDSLTWPEQFLKDTTGFVQTVFHKPAAGIAGFFENLSELKDTYDENRLLKSRLEGYVKLETEVYELKQENEDLKKNLDKKGDLSNFDITQAEVIGRGQDRWQETLTVNKGSIQGIEKNMAVITADGLIGKIKSTSTTTSTVQLLSGLDQQNRISAKIQEKKPQFGFINGYDNETKALMLKEIPYEAKIAKGTTVITSGLGGVFPAGLPIGKVKDVVIDQYGLTQTALVEPVADFYHINNVMIVERTEEIVSSTNEEGTDL